MSIFLQVLIMQVRDGSLVSIAIRRERIDSVVDKAGTVYAYDCAFYTLDGWVQGRIYSPRRPTFADMFEHFGQFPSAWTPLVPKQAKPVTEAA